MLDEYLARLKTTWRGTPDLTLVVLTNNTIKGAFLLDTLLRHRLLGFLNCSFQNVPCLL